MKKKPGEPLKIELTKEPELLTFGRAAAALGIHRNQITVAIRKGQLIPKRVGNRDYLLRNDLLKFLGQS